MSLIQEGLKFEKTLEILKKENEDLKRKINYLEDIIPIILNKEQEVKNLELYTVLEVSEILKVSKNYVYQLIRKGELKGLKLGRIKVSYQSLSEFIRRNEGNDLSDLDNIKPLEIK